MVWDGRPAAVTISQEGSVPAPFAASNTSTAVAVTFPAAFAARPALVCSTQNPDMVAGAPTITATGCILQAYRPAGTVTYITTIHWIARGVRA